LSERFPHYTIPVHDSKQGALARAYVLETLEAEWTPFAITNQDILCPERIGHGKADKIAMTEFTVKKDNLDNLVSCFFHAERQFVH